MSISLEKRIILVHIPKTGGQSIHKALGIGKMKSSLFGFHGDKEYSHFTAREIREHVGTDVFNRCFKLAVVRNPFDRLLSEYHFKRKGDRRFIDAGRLSFEEFVMELGSRFHEIGELPQREICHFTPQADFVHDGGGRLMVDRLFRFEEFSSEIAGFIQEKYGVRVPHINRTDHSSYAGCYSAGTRAIVERIYRRDLEAFGYVF
jgi:chondroitin 4-sulfotransferase 11